MFPPVEIHRMIRTRPILRFAAGAALVVGLVGCANNDSASNPAAAASTPTRESPKAPATAAKISAEDQALIDAQGWCAIEPENKLGDMGPPIKLTLKGQPVFICCKGCQKTAEADPDKTLAKVEELKAKVKAEKTPKGGS
jgi:hypothetical protein